MLLTISIPASPRKAVLLQLAENADGKNLERLEDVALDEEPSGIVLNPDDNPLARLSQKGPRWPLYLIRIAVLALFVTPNITPDDRIMLDLRVNQDTVGALVPTGTGGFIPSIDTTQLETQVLVGNGETVVLGGVFKTEDVETVDKVPFFGDIPYIGAFFRSETQVHKKTETLIFITPRILADTLLD